MTPNAPQPAPLRLQIDPAATVAPFEQLRRQLADRISGGELLPGTKLPTVRALAAELGIAANTVARTYRELEATGLLRTAGRSGTFVAEPELGEAELATARRLTRDLIDQLRLLGVAPERITKLVAAELDRE